MMKRYKPIIGVLSALLILTACRDDIAGNNPAADDGKLHLSGINTRQVKTGTRADATGFFPENTLYRVWADERGKDAAESSFLFNRAGYDIITGAQHYIRLPEETPLLFKPETDEIDFYALTDLTQKTGAEAPTDYLDITDGDKTARTYTLTRTEKDTLTDVRHAQKTVKRSDNMYVIPLEFKHILSKVNFEILQQEAEEGGGNMFGDLTLTNISVPGHPTRGVFDIKKGEFTELDAKGEYSASFKPVEIGTTPQKAGHVLLFPTPEGEEFTVNVTLQSSKKDFLSKFAKDPGAIKEDNGKFLLTLACPVNASPTTGQDWGKPLQLKPNFEYTVQFMIMSNDARIITIVPRVYEWLEGEGTPEHPYEEQDLGQPITFNGVVWSDRNLGASSAHPLRSIEDWRKSVGYYYQFNRNIPYFPNDFIDGKIDLKTDLETALSYDKNNMRTLYPVVNFTAWGVDKYPEKKFIAPASGDEGWNYISQIGIKSGSNDCWSFIHNNQGKHEKGLWQNKATQPCPKGWRLPTLEDFKGILPGSAFSGNITFRMLLKHASNGGWRFAGEETDGEDEGSNDSQELNFPEIFKSGGKGMDLRDTNLPGTLDCDGEKYLTPEGKAVPYLGEFPCLFRCEADDPQPGRYSQYILSMHGNDWQPVIDRSNQYRDENFIFNWGTIYAIKNQGTSQAYRIKWEVKFVGDYEEREITETIPDIYRGKKAHVYDGLYGVLVISRYTADKNDKFTPDENGSFVSAVAKDKWANPVEVMYLPICGGGGKWKEGRLYNVGTETWYATSECNDAESKKGMVWLKILGDNKNNQGLFYEPASPMYDLLSVRPVRDN